ncbi:hypothetical protein Tco_0709536, partial [Tanacetum coccineum]
DKNAWQSILHGMSDARNGNNVKSVIRRLLLAACVYHIWQERNNRIFKDSKRSSEEVFKSIVDVIKNKLSGITVKASNAISEVEKQWPISCHSMGELRLAMLWLDRRSALVECTIRIGRVYVKVYVPRIVMPCPFSLLIHPMRMQLLDGVRG